MKKYYIYALLDPTKPGVYAYGEFTFEFEPFYIGKGSKNRPKAHFTEAIKYKANQIEAKYLERINTLKINKINSLLEQQITPYIKHLLYFENETTAYSKEAEIVKIIGRINKNTGPLTNLTDGGDAPPKKKFHSVETRKKLSEQKKGKKNPQYGTKGFWHNKKRDQATCEKISKTRKEKKFKLSEEVKQKLRDLKKGKKRDPEIGKRISAKKKGHTVSEETRQKIRETLLKKRYSS